MPGNETQRVPITPLAPALTQRATALADAQPPLLQRLDRRTRLLLVALLAVVGSASALILYLASINPTPTTGAQNSATVMQDPAGPASSAQAEEALAPFAALTQQQAETAAKDALAAYVESEQTLTELVNLDFYPTADLVAAKDLALSGDTRYLEEDFAAAAASYRAAQQIVADMTAKAQTALADVKSRIDTALDNLNPAAADSALAEAQQLSSQEQAFAALANRVEALPEVIALLREARNHELAEQYAKALGVYNRLRTLDPQTSQIGKLTAAAQDALSLQLLQARLGEAMSAIEDNLLPRAKEQFAAALQIDPQNAAALAGLEHVAQLDDVAELIKQQTKASAALAEEQWDAAIDLYGDVLESNPYISFAIDGLGSAQTLQRLKLQLTTIVEQPGKLASEKLLVQAQDVISQGQRLIADNKSLQNTGLSRQVDEVESLLAQYRATVAVTLISDNATDISASNLGALGRFERLTLDLRVGEYTFRGIQAGCRDVYRTVIITPGIPAVDLSCRERIRP